MTFECGPCDAKWSGHNTSHCHRCGLVFTGLGAFDKHLDRVRGICKPPKNVGLILVPDRTYPCWGEPRDADPGLFPDPDNEGAE